MLLINIKVYLLMLIHYYYRSLNKLIKYLIKHFLKLQFIPVNKNNGISHESLSSIGL